MLTVLNSLLINSLLTTTLRRYHPGPMPWALGNLSLSCRQANPVGNLNEAHSLVFEDQGYFPFML